MEPETGFFSFMAPPSALGKLPCELLDEFAGRTVTFEELIKQHHPRTNFIESNYRTVLQQMTDRNEITIECPHPRRHGTFGPKVRLVFPSKG